MRMEYERLVCRVWGVPRFGDPMGLADADKLGHGNANDLNTIAVAQDHPWLMGISSALKKAKKDQDHLGSDFYNAVDSLDDRLWAAESFKEAMTVMEDAHQLFDQHGIY